MEKNNKFSIEIDKGHLSQIEDISNANTEVFVTLEDGFPLTIIVGTPKNLEYLMTKDEKNFYGPGLPWVIVKKLTPEIIHEAIENYMEDRPDGYWLKLYHFATDIDNSVFDELQTKTTMRLVRSELFAGLMNLITELNKLTKLEQSKRLNLVSNLNRLLKLIDDSEF